MNSAEAALVRDTLARASAWIFTAVPAADRRRVAPLLEAIADAVELVESGGTPDRRAGTDRRRLPLWAATFAPEPSSQLHSTKDATDDACASLIEQLSRRPQRIAEESPASSRRRLRHGRLTQTRRSR
jgi:hypothetical protein